MIGGATGNGAGSAGQVAAGPAPLHRLGIEAELLAPPGSSRQVLADELAGGHDGTAVPVWHVDSEPSLVPGMGTFLHLSRGFEVQDGTGQEVCRLVDDITIRADLRPAAPDPRWFRVLSDDARLLRLVSQHCAAGADLEEVLDPLAQVFGAQVGVHGAIRSVRDGAGATVAMAAAQPGERERVCEVVTTVLADDHRSRLDRLLAPARALGFMVPAEAAVHVHLDAEPFRHVAALRNVVRLFSGWREQLRSALGTNPACTRLGPVPAAMVDLVEQPWGESDLGTVLARAQDTGLTKFADVNLTRVVTTTTDRNTLEVRILPGSIDTDEILAGVALVQRLLTRCLDPAPLPAPDAPGHRAVLDLLDG